MGVTEVDDREPADRRIGGKRGAIGIDEIRSDRAEALRLGYRGNVARIPAIGGGRIVAEKGAAWFGDAQQTGDGGNARDLRVATAGCGTMAGRDEAAIDQ